MKFAPRTKFPADIYVVYQSGGHNTILSEVKLTQDGGNDDATVYHLFGKTVPMDDIDSGGSVVLIDPDTIVKMEQLSEPRYHHLREQTMRRVQSQDIEGAIKLHNLVQAGTQANILTSNDNGAGQGAEKPPQPPTSETPPQGNGVAEEPFVPKTVPSTAPTVATPVGGGDGSPATPSRDEEVSDHAGTLIEIPPPS